MTEERLFDLALQANAKERAALLDRECAGNPELRRRIEALLEADAQPNFTIDSPINRTGSYAEPHAEAGTVIAGKYKLVEPIGEGGMGSVWLAQQSEPVQRRVAVKLIKAGMDSKQVIARFEAERQALAVMDHPNIAKVLDGGLHDNRPYFVMELVKGVPITQYCDAHKHTPRQRLELFVPVCQAIQHAHQKGIIHRDIKPSNVLVALYDDKPGIKVIDFGVAKATGGTLTAQTIDTGFGGVVGTPQYMSPEQATLNNLDIDTRSDVYALGVLLYELLAGSPPFSRKELEKQGLLEVLRIVREEEPPRPSTKLSTADALPNLCANRGTEPKKLTGLLRNELDWIVMKAMEKDRTRRYETANGFAADVNRYLSGEAVLAHPPGAAYRVRKFVRRHKGQMIAASLVLFTLLAGIAGTTGGLLRANRAVEREADERKKADAAKVEAQIKEAEAIALVKFFKAKVFAAARPKAEGGLGVGVTLRDAVVASVSALEQGFADQPLVEAELRYALGDTLFGLAEYDLAREQFERGRALSTRHLGPDHRLAVLNMNAQALVVEALNRPAEALRLFEELLSIQKRVLPENHPDTLGVMCNLANNYDRLNRPIEALKMRKEVLEVRQRVLPKDDPNTLASMHNLACSYETLGRYADALKLFEEALAAQKRALPPDHPATLRTMGTVANLYNDFGRHAEALKLCEETLAGRKRVLPPEHPQILRSMSDLAIIYAAMGRKAEALRLHEETLAARRRVLPPDDQDTLASMGFVASSYAALERYAEAVKLDEETLAAQKRALPPDHPATLSGMNNLGNRYTELGRHADALQLREETLKIRRRVLPKEHPEILQSVVNMAVSLVRLDRGTEALPLIDDVIAKARTNPSVDIRLASLACSLRVEHFQKTADPAGCRATAEMWEKFNRTDSGSLYDAACLRAITASVQAKTPGADAARLAKDDADRAMQWLQKAVLAGFNDATHLKQDTDLDPLREREDFKKLLADLEKKPEKP